MNFLQDAPVSAYPLTAFDILLNIGLAFVLGLVLTTVYRLTNRSQPISPSFFLTLIILPMVISMIMIVIGNSIARAFGLVGALSIIRFRTAVKDNRDIAYIFFSLAAGMASGVGNFPVAIYGTGLISLLLLALDFVRFGSARTPTYLLSFQVAVSGSENGEFDALFKRYLISVRQLSVKSVQMGQLMQYTYMTRLRRENQLREFIAALSTIPGVERVNMLADTEEPEP